MHSHLDCNYPFNFFYVTVLFVMNILPGYYRNWPRVGLLVSPDLTGRASPWCWFPVAGFRLGFFRYVRNVFRKSFSCCRHLFTCILRCLYFACTQILLREGETIFFINSIVEVQGNIYEMIPGRIHEIDFIVVIKAVRNHHKRLIPSYG